MLDGGKGLVETLVLLISPLKDPYAHQVLQDWILDASPHVFGHLLPGSDHTAPEPIISQAFREPVIVPLVKIK